MLKFVEKVSFSRSDVSGALVLTLPYERRVVSRQRVVLDGGGEAGLFLPRGTVLQAGDVLRAETGEFVVVEAALEELSTVYCEDWLLFSRACYHLGNRHIPLQIGVGVLRYQHDHVLDEMLRSLGLPVVVEVVAFMPEAGAYVGQGVSGDGHGHAH